MNAHVHIARPLTSQEAEEVFADTLSFSGEVKRMHKHFVRLGYLLGGLGTLCLTASVVGWCIMLPLKTTEIQFVKVGENPSGEIAYGVKPEAAAILFGDAEAQHYLRQYVEAREGYVPEMDKRRWDIVNTMSASDIFGQYVAWRKSDTSPLTQLATSGRVEVSHFSFTSHGKGKNDTYEYVVRYNRQEIKGDNRGPVKIWSTTVDFQWHPKTVRTTEQRQDNPGGMLVVGYNPPEQE